jgi:hypothetical protein
MFIIVNVNVNVDIYTNIPGSDLRFRFRIVGAGLRFANDA